MSADQPSHELQRAPATFSLRGLFLLVTGCGVSFALARVGGGFLAVSATFAMLWLWFLVTGRTQLSTYAGIAMVVSLAISAMVPSYTCVSGHRDQCGNNLKFIALALHAYHEKYGSFPPAYVADANGKPLYSWRVLILPFLDQGNLRNAIRSDEAWDGPNNAKVTNTPVSEFHCPSDIHSAKPSPAPTSYVAVVGPHTAWAGATPRKFSDFKNLGDTILVIEIADSGIQWAEPRDLYIGQMPMAVNPKSGQGISSEHGRGVNAVFADGSVRFLRNDVDPKILAELLDLDGCSDRSAY